MPLEVMRDVHKIVSQSQKCDSKGKDFRVKWGWGGGRGRWICVSSTPAWSTESVPGQPVLHRETLSRETKTKTKHKNENPLMLTAKMQVLEDNRPLYRTKEKGKSSKQNTGKPISIRETTMRMSLYPQATLTMTVNSI